VLEDALQRLVQENVRQANVVDPQGGVLGSIGLDQIAQAMARPSRPTALDTPYK